MLHECFQSLWSARTAVQLKHLHRILCFFMKKNENACHESLSNWNNWGKLYRSLSSECSCYLDTCSLHLFINVRFFCVGLPRRSFLSCIIRLLFAAWHYGLVVVQILQKWPKTYIYVLSCQQWQNRKWLWWLCYVKPALPFPAVCRVCLGVSARQLHHLCVGGKDLWKWLKIPV